MVGIPKVLEAPAPKKIIGNSPFVSNCSGMLSFCLKVFRSNNYSSFSLYFFFSFIRELNIEPFLIPLFGVNKLSTPDVDKTLDAILEKMAELNRLLMSLMPLEQKKTIGKYVELMITKATNIALDLMGKSVSLEKDLGETKKELMKEVISSWIALVEKCEELSLYVPPMATASIWTVIDKAMELGMKIGAVSATGTIAAREKVKKKIMENLKKTARERGYIV